MGKPVGLSRLTQMTAANNHGRPGDPIADDHRGHGQHIGPDKHRPGIVPEEISHWLQIIHGTLFCSRCKMPIVTDTWEHDTRYNEWLGYNIQQHVCSDVKFKYSFTDPRTYKEQWKDARDKQDAHTQKKERPLPPLFT